jgi:excisionase family DNA binding protein
VNCENCSDRGWNLRDARIEVCGCEQYDPPKWVKRGDTACLIPHYRDPDRPRRAAVGYVCGGHRDRLEQMIAEMPALYDDLGAALTTSEKPGDRVHSNRDPGLSLNEKVADERQELHNELVRLVRWVVEDAHEASPTVDTVEHLSTWLVVRVDWICAQLDVDEEFANIDRLTRSCWRLAYPSGRHRVEIGTCGDGECPGTLWLTGEGDDARTMSCDDCKRAVEPRYWRRERRRIDGVDVNPWLTLSEAAVQYGTTTRTVERWVKKGRLKSRGSPMRVKASAVEEIMRSFVNRCA